MNILDQLALDFTLPNEKKGPEYLPFDTVSGQFDVQSARAHFELLISQHNHQSHMGELERQLWSRERELDGVTDEELEIHIEDSQDECGQQEAETASWSTTLESEPFWDVYNLVS